MSEKKNFDIVVVGAGVAGISAAYYLSRVGFCVAMIDKTLPMSFTSAQSGENYRNWWPHPTMTDFTNHSIGLMENLARKTGNCLAMTRKGYLLASRQNEAGLLIEQLRHGYGEVGEKAIRIHDGGGNGYQPAIDEDWQTAPDGVDVVLDKKIIDEYYPYLDPQVRQLIHIRRAGEVSFYPLGQYMLGKIRQAGGKLFQGTVSQIDHDRQNGFRVTYEHDGQNAEIHGQKFVNAAGPFVKDIARMLGVDLPVKNILQQKISFEDIHGAIPRNMPFTVDLDDCLLEWEDEEREILREDKETRWLTRPINGGIHCRPDGGEKGKWIKMGWAYNDETSQANWQPPLDANFPDLVLRGASRLNPSLKAYLGRFPRNFTHYGGYYTMTAENWPLIGPMGVPDAYMVGALSGFGTMSACGAGELICKWITGENLPEYARDLSLARYQDVVLMQSLKNMSSGAL